MNTRYAVVHRLSGRTMFESDSLAECQTYLADSTTLSIVERPASAGASELGAAVRKAIDPDTGYITK